MKIIVITNRNLNEDKIGERLFGESTNSLGTGEIRLAHASKTSGGEWDVSLVEEPLNLSNNEILPSRNIFREAWSELKGSGRSVVFYVHGYNTSFKDSLEAALDIKNTYEVDVILFSWPSNPGGILPTGYTEYQAAARTANASSPAFESALAKLSTYLRELGNDPECDISLNLMCFSQGNFLFQRYVESLLFDGDTRIFDNVILMQADVDNPGHERWTGELRYCRRVYVTINENDWVLRTSSVVNRDRLGASTNNLVSRHVRYVDFTDVEGIGKKHEFYRSSQLPNERVKEFFKLVLKGYRAERDLVRDSITGAFLF
ncbi:MAG: alpha/beta hydrolase [Cyanobacteria bacterium P01_F01_bin.150]